MAKTIHIDGVIGTGENEISAAMVREMLPANGTDPIKVKIHSEGGSVFEGFAIYDLFKSYQGPKSVSIESVAFSIASFIPMAFDDIEISPNGFMMLHNPYTEVAGDAEKLVQNANLLNSLKANMVKAYCERTRRAESEIEAMLAVETWLNAKDSVALGLANRIAEKPVTVTRPLAKQNTMPHGVVVALLGATSGGNKESTVGAKTMSDSKPVAATISQIRAVFPKAKSDFIVRCMEKEMAMEQVQMAAMTEMEQENETLSAKVAAMEKEVVELKAQLAAKAEMYEKDDDEEGMIVVKPSAKSGVKPVAAGAAGPQSSFREQYRKIVAQYIQSGLNRDKAAIKAATEHNDIRQAMLDEINRR